MPDLQPLAKIGDNNPPADPPHPILESLERAHKDRMAEAAQLELEARKLPREPESDADVEAISAWIVKVQRLERAAEADRKIAKAPNLLEGKAIDGFFASIAGAAAARIPGLEQRKTAFLVAKRNKERIERERLAAEEREREALARAAQEKAEAERRAADAAAAKALADMETARGAEALAAAEVRARESAREAEAAALAESHAANRAKLAEKVAEKAETQVAKGGLERVTGSGATSTLTKVWNYRIADREAVRASLGPLCRFLGEPAILAALERCAKSQATDKVDVPGVEFYSEDSAQTRATRS
jgi:hypothetical protein